MRLGAGGISVWRGVVEVEVVEVEVVGVEMVGAEVLGAWRKARGGESP